MVSSTELAAEYLHVVDALFGKKTLFRTFLVQPSRFVMRQAVLPRFTLNASRSLTSSSLV